MLDLTTLRGAVAGDGVGLRARTPLEPLAGPGTKIFPPTYSVTSGLKYAVETRRANGNDIEAVVLDSTASQANRLELALLEAYRAGELQVPVVSVDFRGTDAASLNLLSSLEAPHRIFDALLRDSLWEGAPFRFSPPGLAVTEATTHSAAALYRLSPTTLLFGGWDSTGPKGGRGAKYERCITSEIVATGVQVGKATSSRLDPAGIESKVNLYEGPDGEWTLNPDEAVQDKKGPKLFAGSGDKPGRPSLVNHGNIAPSIIGDAGGVTADEIVGTTVISFPALRRLRFPVDADGVALDGDRRAAEAAARTALAALGVVATVLAFEDGFDLRSRCVLHSTRDLTFELLRRGGRSESYTVERQQALALVGEATAAAAGLGLAWASEELLLTPAPRLVDLIRRSHEVAAAETVEAF